MRTVVELMEVTIRELTDSNKPFHSSNIKDKKFRSFRIYICLCALVLLVLLYLSPCNRSSAGSLLAVERSRVRTMHVMLVMFLSSDVTTVSVDMTEVDVSGTSVISNPFRPLKIFLPFASQRVISPTYVQTNFATLLSVVFTD